LWRGENVSYEYLTNCIYDLDVIVGFFCILSINVGVFTQRSLVDELFMGADLKQKEQQRRKIIVRISIPSGNVRTIVLCRDPLKSDCRVEALLIETKRILNILVQKYYIYGALSYHNLTKSWY